MKFSFLPSKVKEIVGDLKGVETSAVLRSSGSLDGVPGEGYIIAFDDRLLMLSKTFNDNNFSVIEATAGDIVSIDVREEKFNSYLDCDLGAKGSFKIKFSTYEKEDLNALAKVYNGAGPDDATVIEKLPERGTLPALSPMIGMAACLLFAAGADDKLDPN